MRLIQLADEKSHHVTKLPFKSKYIQNSCKCYCCKTMGKKKQIELSNKHSYSVFQLSVVFLFFPFGQKGKLKCHFSHDLNITVNGNHNISRGTKVEKMLTLAPERYTAGFRMVAKVILRCI